MNNKGLIEPVQLTTGQRNALIMSALDTGIIWNTTTVRYEVWNGTQWKLVSNLDYQACGGLLSGDINQPNNILTVTQQRLDSSWSLAANAFTYTGSPDKVDIASNAYFQNPLSNALARVSPLMILERNGIEIARADSAYVRHANVDTGGSNAISFTDLTPGVNPTYRLLGGQGSNQNDVIQIDTGHFALTAWAK